MISLVVSYVFAALAAIVAIPTAMFCIETIAGLASMRRNAVPPRQGDVSNSRAVLVPAHNESTGLQPTLCDIKSQLRAGDRLLVVADNCTDDTAKIALDCGAEIIERNDPAKVGKGYALDFGIQHLASDPPELMIVIDADCRVAANALDELSRACMATDRPTQAVYMMHAPASSQVNHKVAEFAWRIRNWLRPLGLNGLGLPCQLMGTGMAFPWDVIELSDLANGCIVEDLKLGLDLARAGHPPLFCPAANISSEFASSAAGSKAQRSRWEHGHIHTIITEVPRLILKALATRDFRLLILALDLAVPPLSLLAILLIGLFGITMLSAAMGMAPLAATISTASLLAFLLATGAAWAYCGRDLVPPSRVLSVFRYALAKLSLYRLIVLGRMADKWVKTDRRDH